ncbi:unnamed protein product [Microthlaspi erraticum]|uniref:Uncharacterized protein n=2 Tax=Microthlaspi erraticum TaxID=1685480 RepID=A0A6D2HKN3_9BRAS|nr:unnamed protein product [Microthlaspi erraticum]
MATSALNSTIRRTTPLAKSSESGDDSSYSTRRSIPRRYRSLSRFSHRMPDPDAELTPMRKGKFVNTVRGSGFAEISLDDLAVEFFESFSGESGVSSGERERSGSRNSGGRGGEGEMANSQRRGRSVSRVGSGGSGGLRRLDAETESSRRRRSLSRQPSTREITGKSGGIDTGSSNSSRRRSLSRQPSAREITGKSGGIDQGSSNSSRRRSLSRQPSAREITGKSGGIDQGSSNSSRRRSLSRQPRERVNSGENSGSVSRGRAIGADREKENARRRRSLSVVRRRIDNSESDVDQVEYSSNSRDVKSGQSQISGSRKPTASDQRQGLRRSFSQNPVKYHDGYSSQSSAVTDDEGKESRSSKHGTERIIRTVYAQNKVTPKKRESLGNSDYGVGSQRKSYEHHHANSTSTKGYATKLQESEERKRELLAEIMLEEERGRELSLNLKNLLTENSSESNETTARMRKRSKDRRLSMCLTDEAEQYIDEFISNIEDTDFSSFEDERSESSSSFGLTKSQTTLPKSVPVEMDGVMLPWLQWDTPDDTCAALTRLDMAPHTPNTKLNLWESGPAQDASSGRETTSIGTVSSRGSWSPYESATKPVDHVRRLKIDVGEYLKRPNSEDILNETWKLRHRISSGSLVLS